MSTLYSFVKVKMQDTLKAQKQFHAFGSGKRFYEF